MDEMPVLRQLLLCEKLIIERDTNNVSLINCHSIRRADRFPTPPIAFAVYGLLTDGHGSFTIQLEITRLDTGDLIFRCVFPMTFADRLRGTDFACRINDLTFPAAGKYEIVLSANQELLGITSIELQER
jgi:hypothetical protein